jgi:hypothetical protein
MLCYHLFNSCFVPATDKHPGWFYVCITERTGSVKHVWLTFSGFCGRYYSNDCLQGYYNVSQQWHDQQYHPLYHFSIHLNQTESPCRWRQHAPPKCCNNLINPMYIHKHIIVSPQLHNLVKKTTGHVSMSQKMPNVRSTKPVQYKHIHFKDLK